MKQKYKHLAQKKRYSIERKRKVGYKQNEIAELLDRSQGTISREIRRNIGKRGYRFGQADNFAAQRRKAKRFTAEVQKAVESYLHEDYSPEQVTGFMRRQGEDTVSHERIHQHIYANFKAGGDLHKHLCRKRKRRKRRLGRPDKRGAIVNRVSIEERPASVDSKSYYGDWEGDLIVGCKNSGAVLTLAERKTQLCLIYPLQSKRSDEVQAAMIKVLQPFVGKIRSITLDNGKEFAGHEGVSEALGTQVYFAHPHSPWERGTPMA
jgi:IS30 family transposase